MKNRLLYIMALLVASIQCYPQPFKFAFLSDTHIGVRNADKDLERSITDINADTSLKFVIISGDITELGIDEEMWYAKRILSKLKKPLYIQTGNHDANWSPNGGRIFKEVFGPGRFSFQYNGYLFIGTNAGPIMQHKAPGQVPTEDIFWMDSLLSTPKNNNIPLVYVNHFPQDSSQKNWYEAMDRLKKKNLQLFLVGHGHINHEYVFEGVPGIMGRSNMRAADSVGGYNIVTFREGKAIFEERKPIINKLQKWAEASLINHRFISDTTKYNRPSYAVNSVFSNVKVLWQHEEKFDIGAGIASNNNLIIATNTDGYIFALNLNDGSKKWAFQTRGKIYSTPSVSADFVVVASTDSLVYCLKANNGELVWKFKALRPIVASPTIYSDVVYIGGSDGHFRAISLHDGKIKWDYKEVKDFVVTKPLIYNGKVYFGSWGSEFYALSAINGKLAWKWTDTSGNRMFSPAGCRPVAAQGNVFIVAPDQFMTAFEAATGKILWRTKMPAVRVRESMGLSADSSLAYVKTTDDKLYGVLTSAHEMQAALLANLQLGYDMCAAPIVEDLGVVYVPSNSGVASAVERQTGKVLWKHKISNSNITSIVPLDHNKVVVSSVNGIISCLQFQMDR